MASRFLVPFGGRQGADPLFSIYREMNRMFDDVFSSALTTGGGQGGRMTMPALDVQEKDDELTVSVELPGVRSEDVDVRLERDVLTISGEKKSESDQQQSNVHVMERSYGRFTRSLQLPFTPDPEQVSAEYEHGVLKVRLKRQPQQQGSRRIQVRAGESQGGQLGQQGMQSGQQGTQSSQQGMQSVQQGAPSGQASGAGSSGGMDDPGSAAANEGASMGRGGSGQNGVGQGGAASSGSAGRA